MIATALEPLPDPAAGTPAPPLEAQLAALEPAQQIAVLALASGLSRVQAAREAGVTTRTIVRWRKDPQFVTLCAQLAPAIAGAHVRAALAAFMDVVEKDRKKGVAHNARWLLARTLFRDVETERRAAGRASTNVGVGVNVSQELTVKEQQRQVGDRIAAIWEARRRRAFEQSGSTLPGHLLPDPAATG